MMQCALHHIRQPVKDSRENERLNPQSSILSYEWKKINQEVKEGTLMKR